MLIKEWVRIIPVNRCLPLAIIYCRNKTQTHIGVIESTLVTSCKVMCCKQKHENVTCVLYGFKTQIHEMSVYPYNGQTFNTVTEIIMADCETEKRILWAKYCWYVKLQPITVAARSEACACGLPLAGIASLNPAAGMDVCLL